MKRLLHLALASAMCLGLAAAASAAPLKIGVLAPLTGPEAADGQDIKKGAETAVAAFGAMPGFDKIEVIAVDDACDPKQAVSGANKLVNEKVVGVVGTYCSSSTIPASEVLDPEGIIMITPASTNPKVTERGLKNMFRMCGRDDEQGPAAVKFMVDELKAKTLYIIDDKTTYSQGLADKVNEVATKMGIKVLGHEHVVKDEKDFSAVLTKLKAANPDAFYMSLQNNEAGSTMAIQAKRIGITCPIVGQDAIYHPNFATVGKDAAEGVYATFGYTDVSSAAYKKFIEAYKPKHGDPGGYSSYAYDAMTALLTAIKNAGATDSAKVQAALMKLDMPGASKPIKFDAKGDAGSNYIIWKVKGGKFVEYYDPATKKKF